MNVPIKKYDEKLSKSEYFLTNTYSQSKTSALKRSLTKRVL